MGLFAVHLSDGVLTPTWWIGGWVIAALLVLLGSWRLRDEDIPRVALLSAVFFVVSLVHVPVPGGPRAHLLLAGLLGVVLGRHAALAIPLGLVLQTVLFSHGGLTMIGVNAVVMTIPALLARGLFVGLRRLVGQKSLTGRAALLFASTVLFLLSAVFAGALLATNPLTETDHLEIARAVAITFAPVTLILTGICGLVVVILERRNPAGPEFALGLLVGEVAVLVAVALNGAVLLLGGEADWHALVFLTMLIHLPLAIVEGIVLGFTIRFLVQVQPTLIGIAAPEHPATEPESLRPSESLLALLAVLLVQPPLLAHGLESQYKVDLAAKRVTVECWYETADVPRNASIVVRRPSGEEVTSGKFDVKGMYQFSYEKVEDLVAEIDAGGGHRARFEIPASRLQSTSSEKETIPDEPKHSRGVFPWRDVVAGLALVLALGAFLLSVRNQRRLQQLEQKTHP